jgi:DHA3 family macrolide efflux protein-like MFS transporter
MVPERHLLRIQAMNQALEGLLNVVAAPLGALLLSLWPMAGVVLVDVATALPASVALLAIDIPRPSRGGEGRGPSAVRRELADGFRYLWARPGHRTLVALSAAINACLVPAFALLPLLVVERLRGDALQLGWLTSAFGVGLLLGGLLLGVWGGTRRRIVTTLGALVALGLGVAALGLAPPGSFRFALAAMLLVGFSVPAVNGPVLAILQATVSPAYQARVFSLMGSLAGASAPVGLLLAAPVAELVGVRAWYLAGGVMCLAMAATGLLSSSLMDIERPVEDQAAAAATA